MRAGDPTPHVSVVPDLDAPAGRLDVLERIFDLLLAVALTHKPSCVCWQLSTLGTPRDSQMFTKGTSAPPYPVGQGL